MTLEQKKERIVAAGTKSGHCHVITGDVEFKGENVFAANSGKVFLKHLIESSWLAGQEVWTGEHHDIEIDYTPGKEFKVVRQKEKDVFDDVIREVLD